MKSILKLFFLVTFATLSFAQESDVKINYEGKDFTQLKFAWKAQWITHPTESTLDSRKFLFRKEFNLNTIPEKFIIYVSADNRYKLYVNGEYVVWPASSDINNYRYETLDIAKYLKSGKNLIAAEVVNFGEYKKASTMSFQTAFILQSDKSAPVEINTGKGSGWKVTCDKGFETIPFVSDSLRGYYAAGSGEILNSKQHPWGWKSKDFDDQKWLTPKAATVEFAVGRGFLFGSTWYLTKRNIPFMEESLQRFAKVSINGGLSNSENLINGKGSFVIPAHRTVTLLLDKSHHTIGHPVMKYSNGKNSEIKITYSEAMYDKDWKKGNRNEVEGKHILGYYDRIIADGGMNREFQPLGQKTFRFVQLDIKTQDEPLILNDFYNVYTAYPFKENAYFKTTDKTLGKIWEASWRTLRNSAVENYIDPYYEQLQYVGDTRIEALVSLSVDGDDRLMKNAIDMFDKSRLPMGLTASRYPSYIVQIIPTYSLQWVNMIHDHYLYKNDLSFTKEYVTGMKAVLDWWIGKVDEKGMPTKMQWWNFTDWSPGFQNGIPPGADDGYSACIALQLVNTLQYSSEMFKEMGYIEEAQEYKTTSDKILKSVVSNCYVPEKKLFAETPEKRQFSQHTNILAILTDAIPKEEQAELMKKILEDQSIIQTTIYFKFYLFEALQKSGLGNQYTSLLENWTNQLDQGLTTFAETDIEPRSECHAWSASPNYHFLKIIAGISPLDQGFQNILIEPNFNNLEEFDANMPHPNGSVKVKLKKDSKNKIKGKIILPSGTKGILKWNGKEMKLKEGNQSIEF